jgi:hypothetical protein
VKIYIILNGKEVSFATTIVVIFALSFISLTNPSLTYAATKDSSFNSNAATSGPSGYIPPPQPLTTSTTQKDQIANNNNPSTSNTISNSSGQSQLNQGQQPNSNCNTIAMVECGSFNPSKTTSTPTLTTTTPTQGQQPNSNCNTIAMVECGSFNPSKTTSTPTLTTTTPTQGQQPNSNCNTIAMVECGSFNPSKTTSTPTLTTTTPTQQQPQIQLDQNGALTNNNNLNTFGPINPGGKYVPPNLSTCANDVTGKWIANDGGVYYIRQDGNGTSWFGSTLYNDDAINSKKGFEYANEAYGGIGKYIDGTTKMTLNWDDINVSFNHAKGTLTLLLDPSGAKLTKISEIGSFGPSEWTRTCGK